MTKQRGAKAGGEQVAELSLRPGDPLGSFWGLPWDNPFSDQIHRLDALTNVDVPDLVKTLKKNELESRSTMFFMEKLTM